MFNSMQNKRSPDGHRMGSRVSDYLMLVLATGGVLLNVMFLFGNPVGDSYVEQAYEPSVEALHAATMARTADQLNPPIYVMR